MDDFHIFTSDEDGKIHVEFSPKYAELYPVSLVTKIKEHVREEHAKKARAVREAFATLSTIRLGDLRQLIKNDPNPADMAATLSSWFPHWEEEIDSIRQEF